MDGYYRDPITGNQYCWEFHGCLWHGCNVCYGPEQSENIVLDNIQELDEMSKPLHPITKQPMQQLLYLTKLKKKHLFDMGMNYTEIWEHEFDLLVEKKGELRDFINSLNIAERLNPRAAFFGGRFLIVKFHT